MELENNYYSLGLYDYEEVLDKRKLNSVKFNKIVLDCQQSAEKFLKHLVDLKSLDPLLLRTHSLERLVRSVFPNSSSELRDGARYLQSFYYDSRYPGDNFVVVDSAQSEKCFDISTRIKNLVDRELSLLNNTKKMDIF